LLDRSIRLRNLYGKAGVKQGKQLAMNRWTILVTIVVALALPSAWPALAKNPGTPPETGVNRGVVELETARAAGISVRIA